MAVQDKVSADSLWKDLEGICRWERYTGTAGENAAVRYIEAELSSLGIDVTVHAFESLISIPGAATLHILGEGGRADFRHHGRFRRLHRCGRRNRAGGLRRRGRPAGYALHPSLLSGRIGRAPRGGAHRRGRGDAEPGALLLLRAKGRHRPGVRQQGQRA